MDGRSSSFMNSSDQDIGKVEQFTRCIRGAGAAASCLDNSPSGAPPGAGSPGEAPSRRDPAIAGQAEQHAGQDVAAPPRNGPAASKPLPPNPPEPLPVTSAQPAATLTLPFEKRQKARQRATLDSGEQIAVLLPRGTVMRGGDWLVSPAGRTVRVAAAGEPVSTVRTGDPRALARIAYHLGNRHVAVQVGSGWLRYLADHVLDAMIEGLGASAEHETTPFEPEAGAYGHHATAHGHGHGHNHER